MPQVPTPVDGDEDDDKTVHYTTGPALVTRAYVEGGFLGSVRARACACACAV